MFVLRLTLLLRSTIGTRYNRTEIWFLLLKPIRYFMDRFTPVKSKVRFSVNRKRRNSDLLYTSIFFFEIASVGGMNASEQFAFLTHLDFPYHKRSLWQFIDVLTHNDSPKHNISYDNWFSYTWISVPRCQLLRLMFWHIMPFTSTISVMTIDFLTHYDSPFHDISYNN